MHLHEVFVTCSSVARGFSVVPMEMAVLDEQNTRWVPGFIVSPSATSAVQTSCSGCASLFSTPVSNGKGAL